MSPAADPACQPSPLLQVVYGPHVRVPLTEYVRRATLAGAPVRQYPDITHTLSDQYPLPNWHPAWSLTHGRQAVRAASANGHRPRRPL